MKQDTREEEMRQPQQYTKHELKQRQAMIAPTAHNTREVEENIKALRPKLLPTEAEMDLYEREVIRVVHQELQKAREEERGKVTKSILLSARKMNGTTQGIINSYEELCKLLIDQSELDQLNK